MNRKPDQTPAESRKDRKRAEIVATAQDLFFKEGYSRTSMSQLAAAVGGSKTTLYSYFQSKEELLLAVVQDVVEPKGDEFDMTTMPSDVRDIRAWLMWFGTSCVRKITSHSYVSLERLAAAEALHFPEVGRLLYDSGVRPSLATSSKFVAEAMEKGVLRSANAQDALEQFLEMCLGWMHRRLVWNVQKTPTSAEIEKNVRIATAVFMDGYALPRKAPASKKTRAR